MKLGSSRSRATLVAAALAAASFACAPPSAHAQSDVDFVAAKTAFERSDWRRLDELVPALRGHLLERYARFWQLKSRLDEAAPEAVQAFLVAFPDGPLAERLRVDWLKALGRRGDWSRFALDYPPPSGEDTELACLGVQYRMQRDGAAALAGARPLWFTGASTPDACEPLFAALIARGELTPGERRERLRLAAASGNTRLARAVAATLPEKERIAERDFAVIDRDPQRALAKGQFAWKTPGGRELALYALERAARKDAGDAHDAWAKWRQRLPEADRNYGDARIAFLAARQLNPAANQWFREASGARLTPEQQVWRVRAALRAASWREVKAAIEALPSDEQQEPVWRYWRARALAALDARDAAAGIYASLASGVHFYGLLAAEALGAPPALGASPQEPRAGLDTALAAFGARPEVKRALKLAELDDRSDAIREWNFAIRGQEDDALLVAAEYARRAGLYDRAINTAERTTSRHDLSLRYLAPFRAQFASAAQEQGIDEEILYGIARQESRFVSDIVSSAGAVGLMQLMPATARWVARQLLVTDYAPSRIADVSLNTQFGAFYFKYWQERLGRLPALAAAAYNAGPSRAQAWRPATGSVEGAIWVETIPFNETRDYVKRVLANTMLYTHALGRPYVPLTQRLGVVTPRASDIVAATAAAEP
jgi:soluble lytic murein transglycosylase